jgi:chemotaxis protein CheD
MSLLVVGIGDCVVSNDPAAVLVTYGLGSCIAVTIHDPVAQVGGLLHFMLPESGVDPAKAQQKPFVFADSGIPLLLQAAYGLGAEKRRMTVTAAGGARMMSEQDVFRIGERNYTAMRKHFRQAGILVQAEDVGGLSSRTVRLDVASGTVSVRGAGEREQTLASDDFSRRSP